MKDKIHEQILNQEFVQVANKHKNSITPLAVSEMKINAKL